VAVWGVTAAAVTPATTTERAKMRMANFMVLSLLNGFRFTEKCLICAL
jgi:hypothetical protein